MASSIVAARAIVCELQPPRAVVGQPVDPSGSAAPDQVKVVLQPRLCTLRSYASDRGGVMIRTTTSKAGDGVGGGGGGEEVEMSPFLANLYEYVESTKNSQDFEIITGRLAMMIFAVTMGVEITTGNSIFKKMDIQGLAEGLGGCLVAVTCAATFAYSSSARKKVGRIFTISCNAFIDALIDNIIDGLFYDNNIEDPADNDL